MDYFDVNGEVVYAREMHREGDDLRIVSVDGREFTLKGTEITIMRIHGARPVEMVPVTEPGQVYESGLTRIGEAEEAVLAAAEAYGRECLTGGNVGSAELTMQDAAEQYVRALDPTFPLVSHKSGGSDE